ncbi:peroxisomal 2,4-dienoyl-CoA reductase [(3E)-enoyl-CoA-producing]-like [Antedon mediterranea]|uniref:peroxisomal 2,4-dienoyl-CoA reductase [(3E)-enoyl-CoA-producing]-like n=1 Tax=Antedon mediterranea TaxID=105859 RepID=UPI003AF9254F
MAASITEDYDVCLDDYKYIFNPSLLKGKVAFITGGGSGICFTIAEILMRHKCDTIILSRKLERVNKSSRRLEEATGQRCLPLQLDVRKPQDVLTAVDKALSHFGRIDIVVNGAAGNFLCPAESMSFNAFKTVIEIDTIGTFNISKAVYDKYMKHHGGVIINISATLAYRGQMLQAHAGPAKAAIDALTKHLAVEWGHQGIRVVSLSPGPIEKTEGIRRLGGKLKDARVTSIPLQRFGTKKEIAEGVVYLASPAADFVTGTVLVIDGGSWLTATNDFSLAKPLLELMSKM